MTEPEQRQHIRDNYLTTPVKRLATEVGRSHTFVVAQMKRENLIVPREVIEQRKRDSYFRKGHSTWNKGMLQVDYLSEEAIEAIRRTQFKPGQAPHNTREDGDLSFRVGRKGYGYWYIRTEKGNWEVLHRLIWEAVHGPIPHGCNIQFKDNDTNNVNTENLYMVNRRQQAAVNKSGGNELPFPLRRAIELTLKLKHTIDEKQTH